MIIVVTGQTATGKTKLAIELAAKYNGELVNCDSRQIYKKLDIITGKDRPLDIWLYDVVDPKDYFSSFDYVKRATPIIQDILSRKKTPIIVGGTGLYIKHLLYGFDYNVPPNWPLRKELEKKSLKELQKKVKVPLNQSDYNNPRRLIRRIEILSSKGEVQLAPTKPSLIKNQDVKIIALKFSSKEKLRQAITQRVEKRLKQGAIEEVKNLLKSGYSKNDPGLKTIGYQQIITYLCRGESRLAREQMITKWTTAEVQYAKRQVTYIKKLKGVKWKEI